MAAKVGSHMGIDIKGRAQGDGSQGGYAHEEEDRVGCDFLLGRSK